MLNLVPFRTDPGDLTPEMPPPAPVSYCSSRQPTPAKVQNQPGQKALAPWPQKPRPIISRRKSWKLLLIRSDTAVPINIKLSNRNKSYKVQGPHSLRTPFNVYSKWELPPSIFFRHQRSFLISSGRLWSSISNPIDSSCSNHESRREPGKGFPHQGQNSISLKLLPPSKCLIPNSRNFGT